MKDDSYSGSDIRQLYVRIGKMNGKERFIPVETYYGDAHLRCGVWVVGKYGKELYKLQRVETPDEVINE